MASIVAAAAFLAGLAVFAYGVWLVYRPAGVMAAGLLLAATAVLYVRGGE